MMIQSDVYETLKQDLFIGLHWHYSENLVSHSSMNYEFIKEDFVTILINSQILLVMLYNNRI